ncbi:MAG: ferritin family protein [Spirochaetota bacterium]
MDIFDFAMQMEEDGKNFYLDLSRKTRDKGIHKILNLLAEAEVRHYNTLQAMKQRQTPYTETPLLYDAGNIFEKMSRTQLDLSGDQIKL